MDKASYLRNLNRMRTVQLDWQRGEERLTDEQTDKSKQKY